MPTNASDDLVGLTGRLTLGIPERGPGEVVLPIRGGTERFAAWSDVAVQRNTRVIVIEQISARSVHVTPFP